MRASGPLSRPRDSGCPRCGCAIPPLSGAVAPSLRCSVPVRCRVACRHNVRSSARARHALTAPPAARRAVLLESVSPHGDGGGGGTRGGRSWQSVVAVHPSSLLSPMRRTSNSGLPVKGIHPVQPRVLGSERRGAEVPAFHPDGDRGADPVPVGRVGNAVSEGEGIRVSGQGELDVLARLVEAHRRASGGFGGQRVRVAAGADDRAVGDGVLGLLLDEVDARAAPFDEARIKGRSCDPRGAVLPGFPVPATCSEVAAVRSRRVCDSGKAVGRSAVLPARAELPVSSVTLLTTLSWGALLSDRLEPGERLCDVIA